MLRGNLSQNWTAVLDNICDDYNETPIKKLGWLKPNDINTIYDSNKVSSERKKHNIKIYKEPNFHQQLLNEKNYNTEKNNFKIDDYVYLDFKEELFGKSFDVQVKFTFSIITSHNFNNSCFSQHLY